MNSTEGKKSREDRDQVNVSREIKQSLLTAAISATLRMFIPVFGLFLVGLAIDTILQQPAFFAIIGAILGFVVAAWLIYLQIRHIDNNVTKAVFDTDQYDRDKKKQRHKSEDRS